MKKGLYKFSGITTLIFSIIFIVIAFFLVTAYFNVQFVLDIVSSGVLNTIFITVQTIFVTPIIYLISLFNVGGEMANSIIAIIFAVFSLLMFFWGIKEIKISKRDDEKYLKTKKTCGFASFIKFMLFVYFLGFGIASFLLGDLGEIFNSVSALIGINMIVQVIFFVIAVISFLVFLLPVVSYGKKTTESGQKQEGSEDAKQDFFAEQEDLTPRGEHTEEGYKDQYYNYVKTEPIDPFELVRSGQAQEGEQFRIVPGYNGVPKNITSKGLEDLARLERLRASGAVDEKSYMALKQKICSTNLTD